MTYRCEICNCVSPPNTPVLKIIEYKEVQAALYNKPIQQTFGTTPVYGVGQNPPKPVQIPNAKEILKEWPACKICWDGHMSGLSVAQLIAARRPRDTAPKEKGPATDLTHVPLAQQGGTLFGRPLNPIEDAGDKAGRRFENEVLTAVDAFGNLSDAAIKTGDKIERFRQAYPPAPSPKSKKKSTDDLVAMEESGGKTRKSVRSNKASPKRGKQQDRKG